MRKYFCGVQHIQINDSALACWEYGARTHIFIEYLAHSRCCGHYHSGCLHFSKTSFLLPNLGLVDLGVKIHFKIILFNSASILNHTHRQVSLLVTMLLQVLHILHQVFSVSGDMTSVTGHISLVVTSDH